MDNKKRARAKDKKLGRPTSLEEKHENFIAAMRKRRYASGHQGENEWQRQRQKSEQEHMKRITKKILVEVVQNNGKEMYKKKCAARAK